MTPAPGLVHQVCAFYYQSWFDNARRPKLVARLEIASVRAFDAERQRKAPTTSKSPARRRGQRSG